MAAAVKARIVNENGEPLSPGNVSFETGDKQPTNWQLQPSRHRAGTGIGDSNGEAFLANVAPGHYTLSVEAKVTISGGLNAIWLRVR